MVAVEKIAQQDIVWNSDDQSGLLNTESVLWHIDFHFNVSKKGRKQAGSEQCQAQQILS